MPAAGLLHQTALLKRAVTAISKESLPALRLGPALTVLLELTRKPYWDFYEHQQLFTIWRKLGPERREWLWTERSALWEYVSPVLRTCGKLHRNTGVQALAKMATLDAPPEALSFTATALGDYYRENHRWAEAFEAYSNAINAQPTHLECARTYYWPGLLARWEGRTADALDAMQALRRFFGNAVALLWHWELNTLAVPVRT